MKSIASSTRSARSAWTFLTEDERRILREYSERKRRADGQ